MNPYSTHSAASSAALHDELVDELMTTHDPLTQQVLAAYLRGL